MPGSQCLFAFVASMLLVGAPWVGSEPQDQTMAGRLATVEPAAGRITVVADGQVTLAELFVADNAEVVDGAEPITLSELVILVGRRVTATYHESDGRRLVRRLTVEPEQ
jgi:hypothetical protein